MELFEIINAKAAARQEAEELMAESAIRHRKMQYAARNRKYNRAKNAAFRRHTKMVAFEGICIGVILMSVLMIVLSSVL